HHQGRALHALDDVRHGEGFARAGHAEQGLRSQPGLEAASQLLDRLRLVTGGLIGRNELEAVGHRLHMWARATILNPPPPHHRPGVTYARHLLPLLPAAWP